MSRVYDLMGPDGFGTYLVEFNGDSMSCERVSRPPEALLIPGFVDLHIHGAFGIDFMDASPDELQALCSRLEGCGYEGFLPTTVTADAHRVARAVKSLPAHPLIWGFHLEGPFISPAKPGAQPIDAIEPIPQQGSDWDVVLNDERLKVATIAPEIANATSLISRLMQRNVLVSMGHSNATYDEARTGVEFGAGSVTHMFNAMSPIHHREVGLAGYSLLNQDLFCELIYDRHHVSKSAAEILFRMKGERVIAVSDSTKATGLASGASVEMWGHDCIVFKGAVRMKKDESLCGSAITLLDAFRMLREDFGEETAIRACCMTPRLALRRTEMPRVWLEIDAEGNIQKRHELSSVA